MLGGGTTRVSNLERYRTMKLTTIAAIVALTVTAVPVFAGNNSNGPVCVGRDACTTNNTTNNRGGRGGDASASAKQGQVQGQVQGQQQSQGQRQSSENTNVNLQGNSQSVNIETPSFTYGVFGQISSMANDRCGRVVIGIPYSAHTCNIIMEAENIAAMLEPVYGKAFAAQQALRHVADNDTTMRITLRRAGVIE